jgi:hypothetical protein
MNKLLLRAGGIINALFVLFHVWLGWRIWHWTGVPEGLRALLEIFNVGGALFIAFLAYASLCRTTEMLETGLGRSLGVLVVLLYGSRAASEFVFQPKAQPVIVATCLVVAAVYLVALLLPAKAAKYANAAGALRTG